MVRSQPVAGRASLGRCQRTVVQMANLDSHVAGHSDVRVQIATVVNQLRSHLSLGAKHVAQQLLVMAGETSVAGYIQRNTWANTG